MDISNQSFPPSSLIICTRNRFELLSDTIASILGAYDVPNELLILDQSDVPHPEFDHLPNNRNCDVRYIWLNIIGSSHARNVGILAAKNEILAFIDDDMLVAADWYGALIKALICSDQRTVVTGRVEPAPSEKSSGFVVSIRDNKKNQVYQGRIGKDVLATGHMALYRSTYEEIGGLDERLGPGTRFPGAEDNDYGFRLLEEGYKIIFVADSIIYHRAWKTRRDYVPLFWNYGRGQGAFYAKNWAVNGHYMQSRMKKDLLRFIGLIPERVMQGKLLVLSGSAAFIIGEWTSVLEWMVTHRK